MAAPVFTIRAPDDADLEPIAAMLHACQEHDLDDAEPCESVLADLRLERSRADFDRERDGWVAVDAGGAVLGYAHIVRRGEHAAMLGGHGVAPERRGWGIGSALVARGEQRAGELVAPPGRITAYVSGNVPSAHALFASRGYDLAGQNWRMEIELTEPPARVEWPAGVAVRRYVRGRDDRSLFELVRDAFLDNDGYEWTATFEEWTSYMLPDDPQANHFLVEAGGEPVAAALCPWYPETGWIRQFAVRRDHRRHGLGRALIQQVFGEHYALGQRRVGLGVDSWNTTGAKQFYESCGMRETLRHDRYERAL